MDDEILCPLEGRRSVNEINSKLALANLLTLLTAYIPMLQMRGDEVFSFKVFWFLIHPYILFLQYGLALCIVAICGSVGLFITNQEDTRQFLMRAIGLLFGNIDEHHDQHANDPPSPSARRRKRLDKVMKAFGYVLLSVQSSSTIYTFSRRRAHDAVSQSDVRLLHLACGALGASFLSIVYIIWEPRAPQPDPDANSHQLYTHTEICLMYIRDLDFSRVWPDESRTWKDTRRVVERGISFWERCGRINKISLGNFCGGGTLAGALFLPKKLSEWHGDEYWLFCPMLGGAMLYVYVKTIPKLRRRSDASTTEHASITERALITDPASNTEPALITQRVWGRLFLARPILVDFIVMFAAVFYGLSGWYAWNKSMERVNVMDSELRRLKSWPEVEACPLLWQDSTAGVLWGFV